MTTTPDVADDLLTYAAALPALSTYVVTSGTRNAFSSPERPSKDSDVPAQSSFWTVQGGVQSLNNDGRLRAVNVQVLIRGTKDFENARLKAHAIHDALDLLPSFVGASGKPYLDVRALNAVPGYLGQGESGAEYFVLVFEVHFEQ